jgi:parallel beta-helix repeat protein
MMRAILPITLMFWILTAWVEGQVYVATDGRDDNPGTWEQPFATIPKAIDTVLQGDTIVIRGGSYILSSTLNIDASKSGSNTSMYCMRAAAGERSLLDFSGQAIGSSSKGIRLKASYWIIRGLDVKGAGDNGLEIDGGSHNIIEDCTFFENRDTGVQLSRGASDNRIIRCDSYHNADPPNYENADGFAPKLAVGSNNHFYECRAWGNCDDGWDGYLRETTDVTTTLENCWTWGNGYLKDGTDPGPDANGNGFKLGGGDNSNSAGLNHHFIMIRCMAFENKGKGFDQNNNTGSMTLLNCTAFANLTANYRITKALNPGQNLTVKNCVSLDGIEEFGGYAVLETNSWMSPYSTSAEDFQSIDSAPVSMGRGADGRLPDINFMHLSQSSDLIDAGADVGLPFLGNAPDLGAFESPYTTFVTAVGTGSELLLFPNYPNPCNASTVIRFRLERSRFVTLRIFNIRGQETDVLLNEFLPAGFHEAVWQPDDQAAGTYFCRMETEDFCNVLSIQLIK